MAQEIIYFENKIGKERCKSCRGTIIRHDSAAAFLFCQYTALPRGNRSALYAAGGQAGDQVLLDGHEQDDNGNDGKDGCGE